MVDRSSWTRSGGRVSGTRLWLFTGDLDSDRTAVWQCRTPGCATATRHAAGRCDTCRRARPGLVSPRRSSTSTLDARQHGLPCPVLARLWAAKANFTATACVFVTNGHGGEEALSQSSWRRPQPLVRLEPCLVPGCGRERVCRRGLCWFHNGRLHRQYRVGSTSPEDLAMWVKTEKPRLGAHQFSLAPLGNVARYELLYALQCRDLTPPPLDPMQVRVLVDRLSGLGSVRQADFGAVCDSGGLQYNSAVKGVFRDLRRHLARAWAAYSGVDPYSGDVWEVALL